MHFVITKMCHVPILIAFSERAQARGEEWSIRNEFSHEYAKFEQVPSIVIVHIAAKAAITCNAIVEFNQQIY